MWPFSKAATYQQVDALRDEVHRLSQQIKGVTRYMARSFDEVLSDLDNLTTMAGDRIAAHLATIAELQAAVDAGDQARVEALAAQAAEHSSALEAVADRRSWLAE